MLTPLGKALRKLRIDRGWLLKDMAEGIGGATSFLSGIETGRKAIPPDFMQKIFAFADVPGDERPALLRAAELSRREFTIKISEDFTDADRETAELLARFGELPREARDSVRESMHILM